MKRDKNIQKIDNKKLNITRKKADELIKAIIQRAEEINKKPNELLIRLSYLGLI